MVYYMVKQRKTMSQANENQGGKDTYGGVRWQILQFVIREMSLMKV